MNDVTRFSVLQQLLDLCQQIVAEAQELLDRELKAKQQ